MGVTQGAVKETSKVSTEPKLVFCCYSASFFGSLDMYVFSDDFAPIWTFSHSVLIP
jgi:hypothetical protein